MLQQIENQLEDYGFTIIPSVFAESEISELVNVVEPMLKNCPAAGIRGISQKLPAIQALSNSQKILHSSRKLSSFNNRRIVHLEFSAAKLPSSLEWNL
jgi:hypothetical protein